MNKEGEFMENFDKEEKKPKQIGRKVIKYLILIALLLTTYGGIFYLGNILATKGVIIGSVPEKAVSDLEDIQDTEKYSNLFNLRSMLFSMYDG